MCSQVGSIKINKKGLNLKMMKKTGMLIALTSLTLMSQSGCKDDNSEKSDPVITWENPPDIKYGIQLSEGQLNATADVPGTFVYEPGLGVVLEEGDNQELNVDFTPSETAIYNNASKTATINVIPNGTSDAIFNENLSYGTVSDADGNTYKTITIGTQTWMAENLRTTKYQNGDDIPEITNNSDWVNLTTAAYSSYDNDTDLDKQATFGNLYNWFAVSDNRNIAPEGWHVATEAEWATLADFLGGLSVAGGKLKEVGNTHWNNPNTSASNSSGFTALPSGRREYTDGSFINLGFNGFWWTSSPYNPDYSWYYQINYDFATVVPANFHKQYGFSVRCVKD
jgi:uncharacterized protein (TIGR02145 family)